MSLSLNVLDHEDTLDFLASEKYFDANEHETKRMEPEYEKVQACLGFAPIEVIKKTFADDAVCSQHRSPSISYPPEITLSSIECAA